MLKFKFLIMPTTSKYHIVPGELYGNMKAIEYTQIITKQGKVEWRWKCEDEEGNIYYMRNRALYAKLTAEQNSDKAKEIDEYLKNIEEERRNQMGLRRKYYQEYISNAIKRSIPFNLTFDQFNEIISQPCYYCGTEPYVHTAMLKRANMQEPMLKCVGIDRKDSSKFYDVDNCVPCCSKCNLMKQTSTTKEFLDHIHKIIEFQKSKESSSTILNRSTLQANGSGSGELLE